MKQSKEGARVEFWRVKKAPGKGVEAYEYMFAADKVRSDLVEYYTKEVENYSKITMFNPVENYSKITMFNPDL